MKTIKVQISNETSAGPVVQYLESRIPEETKSSPEFSLIFPKITSCIEDFSDKAKKLAKSGTTIHVEKEFTLPGLSVCVVLEYPKKIGIMERIAGILKRE